MKVLAIADQYVPADVMDKGLQKLRDKGADITVREWEHASIEELQRDNIAIEQGGPEAVDVPDELTADIEDYELLIVQFFPVTKGLLSRGKNLKKVCVLRGGLENADLGYAKECGIPILNTPGRNARAVAEFTIALMMAEIRNVGRAHEALRKGEWRKEFPNSAFLPELLNKTIGIIGYGNVGKIVAKLLSGFDAHIIFYDPYATDESGYATSAELDELFKAADVVLLNLRLTEETYHLITAKQLGLMKPTAILVNTSRSGCVDQEALLEVLQKGKITGAGLDVFDEEPLPADHPFLQLDNVTVTSHLAGTTSDAWGNTPNYFAERFLKQFPDFFN